MTTTCTHTNSEVAQWARLFTVSAAENYTHSLLFMKQLTAIAVSTITYIQKIFPEENYVDEIFAGLKLKILKNQCSDETANILSSALTRTYDAFNKKYLRKLVLHFYANERNSENLIESIEFEYSYDESGGMMNIRSKNRAEVIAGTNKKEKVFEAVRKQTLSLLQLCIVMAEDVRKLTGGALSSANVVEVLLEYTDDTPADYQVDGFETPDEDEDHLATAGLTAVRVEGVTTPYHSVVTKLYFAAPEGTDCNTTPLESQSTLRLSNEVNLAEASIRSDGTSGRAKLDCFCQKFEEEDLINAGLIQCQYCGRRQHSVCYGVLEHHAPLIKHCCLECHAVDTSKNVTDYRLTKIDAPTRKCLANYRRVLAYCSRVHAVNAQRLQRALGYSPREAHLFVKELYSRGVVPNDPRNYSSLQYINMDLLNNVISKYFNVTGTILTQDSHEQPGPLEVLSTSFNSQSARCIDNSQNDPGMQEYRDALRTIDNVDEPETSIAESIKKSVKRHLDDNNRKRGNAKIAKPLPKQGKH